MVPPTHVKGFKKCHPHLCGTFWGAQVKLRGDSIKIRGGLGPEVENRPKNAQTGGAVLRAQHKKLASNSSLGFGRERF